MTGVYDDGDFQVGERVVLLKDCLRIANGRIVSADPNRICHTVRLGESRLFVEVIDVLFDGATLYDDDDELLIYRVGENVIWPKADVSLPTLSSSSTIPPSRIRVSSLFPERSTENNNLGPSNSGRMPQEQSKSYIQERVCESTAPPFQPIPRERFPGMKVMVVDSQGVRFAEATVQDIDPRVQVRDVVLGDLHIAILFKKFTEDAEEKHLNYRDTLWPWPLTRLLAEDGRDLHTHHSNASNGMTMLGVPRDKRSYVCINRMKRVSSEGGEKKPKRVKVMEHNEMMNVSKQPCCREVCAQKFPREKIGLARQAYWEKTFKERMAEKTTTIQKSICFQDLSDVRGITLRGESVCLEAWRVIHGLGKTSFNNLKKAAFCGLNDYSHGNTGTREISSPMSLALSTMRTIIDAAADNHPAKLRTLPDNSKEVLRVLPSNFSWDRLREQVNNINIKEGRCPISQTAMSRLRAKYFPEVGIHAKSDNFSRCNECLEFKERKARMRGCKEEIAMLRQQENDHHQEHTSGRLLYEGWVSQSHLYKNEYLCIMHDKMDHSKTALPKFKDLYKDLDGVQRLPITVTGALTHGHGPEAVAQFNVGVWPGDSNAMVGSLASLLRMLENPKPLVTNMLEGPDSTNLFEVLMFDREDKLKKIYFDAFKVPYDLSHEGIIPPCATFPDNHTKLPRVFKLQLDNCAADNKNRYVFSFLSLLTAREIFEEVHVGFLMVGHTHTDVDGMFGHFSNALRQESAFTLPELMSRLHGARTPHPIPTFVQEVPDYKSWIDEYMLKGRDALIGHLVPRLFRFYIRGDKMPCMQYKLRSADDVWLPESGIECWKWIEGSSGKTPFLPFGQPKRLKIDQGKIIKEVIEGAQKHAQFFGNFLDPKHGGSGYNYFEIMQVYYSRIAEILEEEVVDYLVDDENELQYGFWPISRWRDQVPREYINVACALDQRVHFVGPARERPQDAFEPRLDIKKDWFILARPHTDDLKIYNVYLGKVMSDVRDGHINADGLLEHVVDVEWWRPYMEHNRRGEPTLLQRWRNAWKKKWEKDTAGGTEMDFVINSVLWCFKPQFKKDDRTGRVGIPKKAMENAQDNLRRCIEAEV